MICTHRELLARIAEFNRDSPTLVLDLLNRQDNGELPVDGLRALGHRLGTLAADCLALADGRNVDRVIIDARPD